MRHFTMFLFIGALIGCANSKRLEVINQKDKMESSACNHPLNEVHLCARLAWENPPSTDKSASFFVSFEQLDADYAPLADPAGRLNIYLFMPDMGHSSGDVLIEKVAPGIYKVSHIDFSMPGNWELHFELLEKAQGNKQIVRDQFKVDLTL